MAAILIRAINIKEEEYVPSSAVLGAVMVLAADILARTIMPPEILPVGLVLSFVGAPFFGYLLFRRRRRYWG